MRGSYNQRSAHQLIITVTVLSAFGFIAIKYRWVELSGVAPPVNLYYVCLRCLLCIYLSEAADSPFNAVALILAAVFFIFVVVAPGLKRQY